jgi:predicted metal-dependent HD superfamily phosphohydrolase
MGSVFLRGDLWVGDYKDRGKIKRVTFGKKGVVTKTMAKEMLSKTEQKVRLGQYDMLDAEIPTLREFTEDYNEYHRDVKQKKSWKKDVEHLKRWSAVSENHLREPHPP